MIRRRCGSRARAACSIASSRVLLERISFTISSMSQTAKIRPSRMCAALLGLAQQELRPADDDLLAVVDEVLDQLLEPHASAAGG